MALREKSIKKAYPLDSSASPVSFDDNGAPIYDREYNASDIRETYARYFSDGVFSAVGEKMLVKRSGGAWYVRPGSAMCAGLRIDLDEAFAVIDQADIEAGKYAYICVEARFDSALNDGHIYARLSTSPTEKPIRTASNHEVILARINWRGDLVDLRLDKNYCGPVSFLFEADTDNFVDSLITKVGMFDLSIGLVEALAPDERPYVKVTKPTDPGNPTVVDFGLPQGPTGPKGATGATGPKGDTGPRGAAGLNGAAGPAGKDGATGPQGPQGVQGPKGEKGDKGEPGESGVVTQIGAGLFGVSVRPNGDLVLTYADGTDKPPLSLDSNKNLIYTIPEA